MDWTYVKYWLRYFKYIQSTDNFHPAAEKIQEYESHKVEKKQINRYIKRISLKEIKEIILIIYTNNIPQLFNFSEYIANNKINDLENLKKFKEVFLIESGRNIKIN
ncbi:MAG: hypothetical protein L7H18_01625 [Candidatus Nealsonbacteria bacterium DGGOD1a]|nr:MAG: hypothetical protein L7H18_01625 [Candidatus Nealsonbacteria bacterium DGGOD1a]